MDPFDQRVMSGHVPVQEVGKTASSTTAYYSQKQGGVPKEITSMKLVNRSGSVTVRVSTDGGSNFFAVLSLAKHETLLSAHEIQVNTASGSASYDLFYTYRP